MAKADGIRSNPGLISRQAYNRQIGLITVGLAIGTSLAMVPISVALGWNVVGFAVGATPAYQVFGKWAVNRRLERSGRSLGGTTREVRGRLETAGTAGPVDDRVVSLSMNHEIRFGLGMIGAILGVLALLASIALIVHRQPGTTNLRLGLGCFAAVMGLGGVFSLGHGLRKLPAAWADATGFGGFRPFWQVRQKFVPWSDVATCEVVTHRDPWGMRSRTELILKASDGSVLLKPDLDAGTPPERDRLFDAVRARFPLVQGDLWDVIDGERAIR